jgi:hypothetical protein
MTRNKQIKLGNKNHNKQNKLMAIHIVGTFKNRPSQKMREECSLPLVMQTQKSQRQKGRKRKNE